MSFFIRVVFAVAACALMGVAAVLLVYAPYVVIRDSLAGQALLESLLGVVGYLIVAIALFDVAKYFFEEEVPAGREKRTAADARRGLTKFISTIIIALFLEALVLVFETARDQVSGGHLCRASGVRRLPHAGLARPVPAPQRLGRAGGRAGAGCEGTREGQDGERARPCIAPGKWLDSRRLAASERSAVRLAH